MIVSYLAHTEQIEDFALRLAAAHVDEIHQERIAADETLFSIRTQNLTEAHHLSGLLYRAGALEIDIDSEAA